MRAIARLGRADIVRILFLIRSLEYGGAQRQLAILANALVERGHEAVLYTFYPGGELASELHRRVEVRSLDKRGRWDIVRFGWRLLSEVRRRRPHVVHGYLPVANLLALSTKLRLSRSAVVWGVRASDVDLALYGRIDRVAFAVSRWLARLPDGIIANSEAGRAVLTRRGYPSDGMVVIPNGIDTDRFRPDEAERAMIRGEWGISEDEVLFGLVGRIDPMKGHSTFLRAAASVTEKHPEARFVCVGDGDPVLACELMALAVELEVADRLDWRKPRRDVRGVFNALDVLVLASRFGEGFPNVVGEAMACGTPCIVTDVGDAADLVGDTGIVVPPGDPEAMASAWRRMLSLSQGERTELGRRARERVRARFGVERLVARTECYLTAVVEGRAAEPNGPGPGPARD